MRVEKGQWNAPTEDQAKIIVLEAQIEKFIKARKQQTGSGKPGKSNKGKQSNKGKDSKPYEKPAWTKVMPKPGESMKKTVDNKTWWWCTKHKSWCRHSTDKCKGRNIAAKAQQTNNPNEREPQGNSNPTLQLSEALTHLAEAELDSEE